MTTTPTTTTALDRFFAAVRSTPLRRSATDRKAGGVCSAVAERLGVSVGLLRILTVVAAFLGVGVPAYLLAWLVLPDAQGRVHLERAIRGGEAGSIVLLVFTALAIIPGPHAHPVTSWVVLAVILAALWISGGRRAAQAPTWPSQSPAGRPQPQHYYPQDATHH